VTTPRRTPAGSRTRQSPITRPRPAERELAETAEPYDLPFPDDQWLPGRPEYVVVVDQLRDRQSVQPPSLAELLEPGRTLPRDPEPDLEAEP
jgi:hypothetical protein